MISIDSQVGTWKNAREKAIDAQEKAQDTLSILKPIGNDLPNQLALAKQMPKKLDDTSNDINQVTKQVNHVTNLVPDLTDKADNVKNKQNTIDSVHSDLGEQIEKLRSQIDNARSLANSVKVGVAFKPSTTLELPAPESLPLHQSNSRVSAYFKTQSPNGFLMYLGNNNNTGGKRTKRDFMAIEIENGYPILTVDLGDGPQRIISDKWVANGQWHQVIVEHNDDKVKLIIREEAAGGKEEIHEKNDTLVGSETAFDIDTENSKLFVGGYPADFNAQDGLKYSSFEGEIEDLRINEQEIGLWNFVDGQDNTQGALERDRLITQDTPTTGYRFSGHGYVLLKSEPYSFEKRSSINFRFKVRSDVTDGLIFYAGKNDHFINVELRNGGINFQYKLGKHMSICSIFTQDIFNDDQWHRVEATRQGRTGMLKVDEQTVYQGVTPAGTEENLEISDTLYFGGYPDKLNHSEIVKKNFEGCIDDVSISGTPVDLSNNLRAYDVRPGCPAKFSKILSYPPNQYGYLRLNNLTSSNHLQINLKFKTKQPEGVLFYGTNHDQSSTIGLVLRDGALVLTSQALELTTGAKTFNDGEWYVVTASHDAKRLRLNIHEQDEYESDFTTEPLYIEHGDIYFGGLPKGFKTPKKVLGTTAYFVGCISDVTIGGQTVNFANSTDRKSGLLDSCARDIFDYDSKILRGVYPDDKFDIDLRLNEIEHEKEEKRNRENVERKRQQEEELQHQKEKEEEEKIRLWNEEENKRRAEEKQQRRTEEEQRKAEENRKEAEQRQNESERDRESTVATTVPTPTLRPSRRRPIADNKTDPICALPLDPDMDVDFNSGGFRFGLLQNTYIEFESVQAKLKKSYDVSLRFKTSEPDGVLFYAADTRHTDFIGLYLQGGKVSI